MITRTNKAAWALTAIITTIVAVIITIVITLNIPDKDTEGDISGTNVNTKDDKKELDKQKQQQAKISGTFQPKKTPTIYPQPAKTPRVYTPLTKQSPTMTPLIESSTNPTAETVANPPIKQLPIITSSAEPTSALIVEPTPTPINPLVIQPSVNPVEPSTSPNGPNANDLLRDYIKKRRFRDYIGIFPSFEQVLTPYDNIDQLPSHPIGNPGILMLLLDRMNLDCGNGITTKVNGFDSEDLCRLLIDKTPANFLISDYINNILRPVCNDDVYIFGMEITQCLYAIASGLNKDYEALTKENSPETERQLTWINLLQHLTEIDTDNFPLFNGEDEFKSWLIGKTIVMIRDEPMSEEATETHFSTLTLECTANSSLVTFYDFSNFLSARDSRVKLLEQDKKLAKMLSTSTNITMKNSTCIKNEWANENCAPLSVYISRSIAQKKVPTDIDLNLFRAVMFHELVKGKMLYKDAI